MTVTLRSLLPDEYEGWKARSTERYATDMQQNGGLAPERALAKAVQDLGQAIPDGLATPGQHVWVIVGPESEAVGYAWLGERETPGQRRCAFVYEIEMDESKRGRGYGRAAMLLLEAEARALGHDRVELNVFGGNEVARGLYRSLGYDEVAVYMGKDLA